MQELDHSDILKLINTFLRQFQTGIISLHKIYFSGKKKISYKELIEELQPLLKLETINYINKYNQLEELNEHLFYFINQYCKNNSPVFKNKKQLICPGCLYLGEKNIVQGSSFLSCDKCKKLLLTEQDPKKRYLYYSFKSYSKKGYQCSGCKRFLPETLIKQKNIFCPYLDCIFIGQFSNLSNKTHPQSEVVDFIESDEEKQFFIIKDNEFNKLKNTINELIIQEEWDKNLKIKHRLYALQSFKNILEKFPDDFCDYMLHNSRSGGFQNKLFQEYIKIIENNLPILIKRNKKTVVINSLSDPILHLFDGISVFQGIVDENKEVKNNTQEFYIGGRKGVYAKPYYIGKILNIIDNSTGRVILDRVKDYNFQKIKFKDLSPGTQLTITHLRTPPHYQLGGMVYINRTRKLIIENYAK